MISPQMAMATSEPIPIPGRQVRAPSGMNCGIYGRNPDKIILEASIFGEDDAEPHVPVVWEADCGFVADVKGLITGNQTKKLIACLTSPEV